MKGQITAVTVSSPPAITFTLTDLNGNAIVGLENFYSMVPGNALPTQRTVTAAIAKLVPGTNGSPSKWVSYNVVTVDAKKTDGSFSGLTTPTTDSNGKLTYLGGGQYKYVFATDITKVKAFVDASTNPNKADVGDTTYDPSLPYRVVIQIAGAARGTGTNTADGVQVAPAVNLGNPVNLIYNSTAPQRDIVAIESCNACHSALAFHGSGARVDTDFCVVCHTNQRKYNVTAAVLGTYTKVYDDGSTEVVPSWNMEPRKFPDGNAMRDFPIMIHSIHAGEKLPVRTAASYIDEVAFPQPLGNCRRVPHGLRAQCHAAGRQLEEQPEPHRLRRLPQQHQLRDRRESPGRGRCAGRRQQVQDLPHRGCDRDGLSHLGRSDGLGGSRRLSGEHGEQRADAGNRFRLWPGDTARFVDEPAGRGAQGRASSSASVTVAANKATLKYRILFDGTPVTFLPAGNPFLLAGIDGTPSLYVTYGLKEDGVTTVADWTLSISPRRSCNAATRWPRPARRPGPTPAAITPPPWRPRCPPMRSSSPAGSASTTRASSSWIIPATRRASACASPPLRS